jgi:hypothetical protein
MLLSQYPHEVASRWRTWHTQRWLWPISASASHRRPRRPGRGHPVAVRRRRYAALNRLVGLAMAYGADLARTGSSLPRSPYTGSSPASPACCWPSTSGTLPAPTVRTHDKRRRPGTRGNRSTSPRRRAWGHCDGHAFATRFAREGRFAMVHITGEVSIDAPVGEDSTRSPMSEMSRATTLGPSLPRR